MSEPGCQSKLERMRQILRSLQKVAVAFSGGVDSTFVLKVAVDTLGPENVVAVTADSYSLARSELEQARQLARQLKAEHVVIATDELEDPNYASNPADRCYYCKTNLYARLQEFIARRGLKAIVSGINADDYDDWRPGIQAGRERNVRAPCAEAGLSKQEIRQLSQQMNLPTFDKPAMPCLASRIAYGEQITPEKLRMVEQAEQFLRSLGLRECRVRHHNKLARIEVPPERIPELMEPQMRARIDARLREIGYTYVTMDMRGFRSGSMNELLAAGQARQTRPVRASGQ